MFFVNQTETIGLILNAGTQSLTGDLVATLLVVFAFLIILCLMFSIPLEFTAIIMLPLTLATAAYYSDFLVILIVLGIYLCTILAKNWLFK